MKTYDIEGVRFDIQGMEVILSGGGDTVAIAIPVAIASTGRFLAEQINIAMQETIADDPDADVPPEDTTTPEEE